MITEHSDTTLIFTPKINTNANSDYLGNVTSHHRNLIEMSYVCASIGQKNCSKIQNTYIRNIYKI